ncbi:MAG TPA: exodeoxyribonuclease VII large subunit [Bacteroidales bacterium]|nr:exodeoxyribonuclease VII large subunit [Bacteroidales bacterium]
MSNHFCRSKDFITFAIMTEDWLNPTIYSLHELCEQIYISVEELCPKNCWVRAEIGSISVKNGNCYMELVEKDAHSGILSAKLRATCWANLYPMLSAYFSETTHQNLQAGMQVLMCGNICFHSVYGLSFHIAGIDPSYTLGDLERQRRETIERLKSDGVIDMQKQIVLPTLVQHIAVISSADAAGYEDFRNQLHNNSAHFYYRTELFPAIVQGDKAEKSIIKALLQIYERREDFQAVAILRGGGATTDLKCFDSYTLAAYCAQFPLPIITGIGHLRDISVVDMVVHTSVKTPTAAAEFLISHTMAQQDLLVQLGQRLSMVCMKSIMREKQKLTTLQAHLRQVLAQMLYTQKNRLLLISKSIDMNSPERIYRLGYSLTTCKGRIVSNTSEVKTGDELVTELQDGKVVSIVQK